MFFVLNVPYIINFRHTACIDHYHTHLMNLGGSEQIGCNESDCQITTKHSGICTTCVNIWLLCIFPA